MASEPIDDRPYRAVSGVLAEASGDKALLLHADGAQLTTVNSVGSVIWTRLPGPVVAIVDHLVERYPDQPRDVLFREVGEFLSEMEQLGLVERADAAG